MFLTEAELTYNCGILLNIGDVMGVQGPDSVVEGKGE